jgi:lipopolysaccharide export system permease protein
MPTLKVTKLSLYVTKELIKKILILTASISILVFILDFSELTKNARNHNVAISVALKIALLQLPSFIEIALQFILLLSALFTFAKLSDNQEMTIMKISKLSIFQLLNMPICLVFLIGFISITAINPASSFSNKLSKRMRDRYFKDEAGEIIESINGLWFRQKNLIADKSGIKDEGEIIIRANKIDRNEISFKNAILIYTDLQGNFIKRLNVKELKFNNNGFWHASDIFSMKQNMRAKYYPQMIIPTNLDKTFILKKIKNDYESIGNISFWELPALIEDAASSGLDSKKFRIRFLYLLSIPFVFVSMIYFAAFFAVSNERLKKNSFMILMGILTGFIIYISHNVLIQLAGSGKVSIFNAVFSPVILYLVIGLFLVIRKEEFLKN